MSTTGTTPSRAEGSEIAHVRRKRPLIAFFEYSDVFEDFYPHYGVDQAAFGTTWSASANHAYLTVVQREVGDVVWYAFSLAPEISRARHEPVGCEVRMHRSSWLHRRLWRLFFLPGPAWRWRRAYRLYATVASYVAPLSLPFLAELRRDRPDVIVVQSYSSGRFDVLLLLARALRVPLVARHAGGDPAGYLGRRVKRWTIPRADFYLVSGTGEGEMLAERYGVPPERIGVVLPPIDTTAYRPLERAAACSATGLDAARRYLLFVGRLQDSVKRMSALVQVFAGLAERYGDVDLLIAGTGPDEEDLRRLVAERAAGRVRFLGWQSGPESLAPLYSAAECLVLPSWREAFPMVVGEALACGAPVVASDVGGARELVADGETGWLLPPGDDAALAAALAFVLEHPEVAASLRPAARRHAKDRLSPETVGRQLFECFSAVRSPESAEATEARTLQGARR